MEKPLFFLVVLVQDQQIGIGTRYDLETLHKFGKKVETKCQRVLEANSYVCRSYRGKTGSGVIVNRVKKQLKNLHSFLRY